MKRQVRYIVLLLYIAGLVSCRRTEPLSQSNKHLVSSFQTLRDHFKNPPIAYSTAPLWVWNDQVTEEKIDSQLSEFKKQGIHMVFIHPRPGLITEYLSREWFELSRFAINKARELNMKIWLYDENSYPSGFAGGHVPALMPESFNRGAGLFLKKLEIMTREDSGKYHIVLKKIGNRFANITYGIKNYYHQPGDYYAFSKWYYPANEAWFGGWSYVDLLAEGVTEKFIKLTMRDYEKTIGEEFGNLVPGIFTDEPNINTRGGNQWVIRWTPALFEKFENKYGYQLQTYLPALYDEIGDFKNIRHDYYALLLDLFIERWAKPWYDYTESKHLDWTGHYWEHGWPNPEHGGDNMAMYAWHQIPGIDMLFNTEETRPDQFGNVRSVKELSSVANQMGRHRSLSETYGGSGWELTFEDMKRLGDWEYALGVNFMNQHLSYMTIKGARKRDFPQSMSYHAPWWNNYKVLNDYFHRLSFVLSSGIQVNNILILEPTSSSWMYFSPIRDQESPGIPGFTEKYTESFHSFLNTLEKYLAEYDLGSERLIRDFGRTEDGKFIVGERTYNLLVLPPLFENIENKTFEHLCHYLESGGKLLSFESIPSRLDGNVSPRIREVFESYPDQWIVKDSLDLEIIQDYFSMDGFRPVSPQDWGGRIFHMRRRLDEGQLLFFTNFDKEFSSDIQVQIPGRSIIEMDPLDGSLRKYPSKSTEYGISLTVTIPPSNSRLYYITKNEINIPEIKEDKRSGSESIQSGPPVVEPLELNMLTLDYCDVSFDGKLIKGIYFYNAADSIFKHHLKKPYGFNYNPWSIAVQYRTNIMDKNRFDSLSGFDAVFPFYIETNFVPDNLKAVVEWPHLFQYKINGEVIDPSGEEWWLDRSFGVLDLTGRVRTGKNELVVSARPMDILAELEPVYLLGNFRLNTTKNGWEISKSAVPGLGSWKDQGYPFYSGQVAYTKYFNSKSNLNGYFVNLREWYGTVAEVWVNEKKVGVIGWQPYSLEISPWIREGENKVSVRVTGSLKNLLGPHHNNPIKGLVTPWSFFYAPEKQPAGEEYDLLDYGLFEDFEIVGFK